MKWKNFVRITIMAGVCCSTLLSWAADTGEIAVSGNAVEIVAGDTTPATADDTDFGTVAIASGTVDHIFTIANSGTAALNLSGSPKVAISGPAAADFTVTVDPTSPVAAGGTTTYTMSFDPSAFGVRTATVSITNDDADENPYTFSIQGTGVVPGEITWVAGPTSVTTVNDIDLTGTLMHAGTWGSGVSVGPLDVTVGSETIPFENRGVGAGLAYVTGGSEYDSGAVYNGDTGESDFNNMLDGFVYRGGAGSVGVVLGGLTRGNLYQIQLFNSDDRSSGGISDRTQYYSDNALDGQGNRTAVFTQGTSPYVMGTFVAADTTQTLYGHAIPGGTPVVNGYVLREIAEGTLDPEITPPGNDIFTSMGRVKVDGGYRDPNYWVWGSTIIKGDDGTFHMYVSRWPKNIEFHPGWMVSSEVVHCVSDTAEGPYTFSDIALGDRGPQYWDGCSQFNPKVFKHNDTYILFYTGSTHPFEPAQDHPDEIVLSSKYSIVGRSNKRIGIATSTSPYGPWTRLDQPILDTKPDTFYSFLTSNPTPVIHEDGSVLLIFKAREYNQEFPFHSGMMIGAAKAPHYMGPYEVVMDEPIFSDDRFGVVEDPFIWLDDKGYHMLAKDQKGTVGGVHHGGILAHSQDGLAWKIDDYPVAYTKVIKWDDGTEEQMGQLERVQGLLQDGKLTHLSFAVMDGTGGFGGENAWTIVVPLSGEIAVGTAEPEITVSGNATEITDGDTTPATADETDFGHVNVANGSVDHVFSISNVGTADLNLSGIPKIAISGPDAADFTVILDPTSPVSKKGITSFTIRFVPSAAGLRTATIEIVNNDDDENPYTFVIQGTGLADSDADGMPDSWEMAYGFAIGINDAAGDADGDGLSNYGEYSAGTDPTNNVSVFAIEPFDTLDFFGTNFVIRWNSISNKLYTLNRSTNLFDSTWSVIQSNIFATPPMNTATGVTSGAVSEYYQVEVQK